MTSWQALTNSEKQMKFNKIFMTTAKMMAEMSSCLRRKTGAVLVKDNRIISTGYNGVPSGYSHCEKCIRLEKKIESGKNLELCVATHAEINAILMCAKNGIATKQTILYCVASPCNSCLGQLINAGIEAVVFEEIYGNNHILKTVDDDVIKLYQYYDGHIKQYIREEYIEIL